MEMWLKRSTLLLLTALCLSFAAGLMISGQAPVILDETQKTVEVAFGSSVNFQCNLKTVNKTSGRFRVKWYFNRSGSSFNDSHLFCNKTYSATKPSTKVFNQTKQDPRCEEQDTQCCIKSNVTYNDSGWYFCEVTIEIPLLVRNCSNGTQVNIPKSKEHTTRPSQPLVTGKQVTVSPTDNFSFINHWMWITLGVSTFILIVLLVLCVLLRRRLRRSRGEDPIYANTRPVANKQPSPRPAMSVGNLKTASSSQNLRNPSPGRRYDDSKQRYKH